jgi:hypothetical protein
MTRSYRYLLLGLVIGIFESICALPPAEAALLDGLMGGVEESLGKRAEENGERLVIGNFYQAERPDSHAPIGVMQDHTHNKGEFMFTYRYMYMYMDKMRNGIDNLFINDVLKDFVVTPKNMTTQMHMFSAMYGLNDTVTLWPCSPMS